MERAIRSASHVRRHRIGGVALLIALAVALSTAPARGAAPGSVLIPTFVGHYWEYDYTLTDFEGTHSCIYGKRVTDERGGGWFGFEEGCLGGEPSAYCISNQADGMHASFNCDGVSDWVFPYPAAVGQVSGPWTVIATARAVTVPAGTFACVVYRQENPSGTTIELSIAPDLGWVKTVVENAAFGYFEVAELSGHARTGVAPAPIAPALRASPNPARSNVRLSLASGAGERAAIEIVDLQGRLVRRLEASAVGAEWDRRHDDGERARPGVYFARVVTPSGRSAAVAVVLAD